MAVTCQMMMAFSRSFFHALVAAWLQVFGLLLGDGGAVARDSRLWGTVAAALPANMVCFRAAERHSPWRSACKQALIKTRMFIYSPSV